MMEAPVTVIKRRVRSRPAPVELESARKVTPQKLAILVGGGPAPGINSVIGAATIRAHVQGIEVLGIRDGFEWIMKGDIDHVVPLDIDDVSRIHFRGGSHIARTRSWRCCAWE